MKRFVRITNPAVQDVKFVPLKHDPIEETDFQGVVGDRKPDFEVDVSRQLKDHGIARAESICVYHAREDAPPGAVTVWSICEESGKAEGWIERSAPAT